MTQKKIILRVSALILAISLSLQLSGLHIVAEYVAEKSIIVRDDKGKKADSGIEEEAASLENVDSENIGAEESTGDDAVSGNTEGEGEDSEYETGSLGTSGLETDSDQEEVGVLHDPDSEPLNSPEEDTQDNVYSQDADSAGRAVTTSGNNDPDNIEEGNKEDLAEDIEENVVISDTENPTGIDEESAEEEYIEAFPLLQQGKFVTEHFFSPSQNRRKFRSGRINTLRSRIDNAIADFEQIVEVEDLGFIAPEDRDTVISAYRSCIRPEFFYISGGFSYYKNKETGIITRIKISYIDEYLDSAGILDINRIEEDVQYFKKRVGEAVDYASQGNDTLERLVLAHDWIVRECDYDYENWKTGELPLQSFSAFGCLGRGTAVCNGYALAYACLLSELGYESYILASDEMNHAWNYVCIDGYWMHVDLTWDDPPFRNKKTCWGVLNEDDIDEGFVSHKYFLKSDREIENLSHSGWYDQSEGFDVPSSDTDGIFDKALFHSTYFTAFNYLDGKFYYCDDYGKIWISDDLWGNGRKEFVTSSSETHYLHVCDEKLFYTDASVIYMYSPDTGEIICVDEGGLDISEMVIKENHLIYITLENGGTVRHSCDTNVRQAGFNDVPHTQVFYRQINWALELGIVRGYADGTFRPQGDCRRKHAVAFLWRLQNTPAASNQNSIFRDVDPKTDFFHGICWAAEKHIVLGFVDGSFRPDAACTRGQAVALLWRLAGRPVTGKKNSYFKDVKKNDSFYLAILWAAEKGIAQGYSDGTFRPDSKCTRGQMIAFLYRYAGMR